MANTVSLKVNVRDRTLTVVESSDPNVKVGQVANFHSGDVMVAIRQLHQIRLQRATEGEIWQSKAQ